MSDPVESFGNRGQNKMNSKSPFEYMDIVLDEDKSRFQAGEEVPGLIRFALKEYSIMDNIKICLCCLSEVKWEENPGNHYHRDGHLYHQKIKLFNQTFTLPKQYEGLSEGEHEVPFKFKLPEKGIPSTFIGPHGTIKYYIEVIDGEFGEEHENRIVVSNEIEVDGPLLENLELCIGCSKEKNFGVLSSTSGKLTLYASLPKRGWVPGEVIELHTTVENQSTVEAAPRVTLYQTQVFMCKERHKALEIPLSDPMVGKKVGIYSNLTETLLIPTPNDLSLTIKSTLISIKYFLHVTLDIPHAFDIHVNVPVVMTNLSVTGN